MIRKVFIFVVALLCTLSLSAANDWGGVKGTVVNRAGRTPIASATITLSQNGAVVADTVSDADGKFIVEMLPNGMYDMSVKALGFLDANVNVTIEGYVKDLIFVGMVVEQVVTEVDDSNFAEFDMDDSGFEDAPSILFESNDPFTNIASFGFSNIRFKNRGYTNESQDVYLSGVRMNDAITGYSPHSLWSGLNEAVRSKETTIGNEASDYGYGGYNGVSNILASRLGVAAIDALKDGQRNVMIGVKNDQIVYVPFNKAIRIDKPIDRELINVLNVLSI